MSEQSQELDERVARMVRMLEPNLPALIERWPQLADPARQLVFVRRKLVGRLELLRDKCTDVRTLSEYTDMLYALGLLPRSFDVTARRSIRTYFTDLARQGQWRTLEAYGIEPIMDEPWVTPMEFLSALETFAGPLKKVVWIFLRLLPSTPDEWVLGDRADALLRQLITDPLRCAGLAKQKDRRWRWAIRLACLMPGPLRDVLEAQYRERHLEGLTQKERKSQVKRVLKPLLLQVPPPSTVEIQVCLAKLGNCPPLRTLQRYIREAYQEMAVEQMAKERGSRKNKIPQDDNLASDLSRTGTLDTEGGGHDPAE